MAAMRFAAALAVLTLAGALMPGCGGSSDSTLEMPRHGGGMMEGPVGAAAHGCHGAGMMGAAGLRTTGAGCTEAHRVMAGWMRQHDCRPPAGASRSSCPVGSYRCLATATDRGWSVGCAERGKSIAFTLRRRQGGRNG